jgi:hypothetical protein
MQKKPQLIIRQQPEKGRRSAFSEVLTGTYLSPALIVELQFDEFDKLI